MRLAALSLLSFTLACGPKQATPGSAIPSGGDALARLDDSVVTQKHFEAVLSRFPPEQVAALSGPAKAELLQQLAIEQALYEQAIASGIYEDPAVKVQLAIATRQALAEAYLRDKVEGQVTDVIVAQRYREALAGQTRPEVRARHILVETEEKAQQMLAEIEGGADFAALAEEHSMDPSAKGRGGDLDWFHAGMMVGAFSDAAFAAEKGEVVGPVRTQFGFHVIKVEDKRDQIPLAEAAPEIRRVLTEEALQKELTEMQSRVEVLDGQ